MQDDGDVNENAPNVEVVIPGRTAPAIPYAPNADAATKSRMYPGFNYFQNPNGAQSGWVGRDGSFFPDL